MGLFGKKKNLFGKVVGMAYETDPPWINASIVIECPDETKISITKTVRSKSELPKKGDQLPLNEGEFGFEVDGD